MAWIKLEHCTPDKPEISIIAESLKIDPDCVVGKLFRIWAWADLNSVDGTAVSVTESFLDRLAHKKGFAAGMRLAGWLEGADGALLFPGFDRHNGETAKARAASNRRMVKSRTLRECCGNVAEKAQQKPQPDKSKNKNKTTSCEPLPLPGQGVGEKLGTDCLSDSATPDIPGIVALFPRREGMAEACKIVGDWLARGVTAEAIASGTRAHAAVISQLPSGGMNKYVESAATFFRNRKWEDDPQARLRMAGKDTGGGAEKPLSLGGRTGTTIKIPS